MTAANLIRLPCVHEGYYLARVTLRRADATAEQIAAALDMLQHSPDWMDMQTCREIRAAQTRKLTDAELAECIGAADKPASGLIREAIKLAIIIGMGLVFYVVTP